MLKGHIVGDVQDVQGGGEGARGSRPYERGIGRLAEVGGDEHVLDQDHKCLTRKPARFDGRCLSPEHAVCHALSRPPFAPLVAPIAHETLERPPDVPSRRRLLKNRHRL
jgi:hypothetical protein